jgi:hypothetical protein
MTDIPLFFVVAFSRIEVSELRAEVAIKALSEKHAASLASHFVGERRGAVAFSQTVDVSTAETGDAKILTRFGDVPDDRTLLRRFGNVSASGRLGITSAPALSFVRSMPVAHSLKRVLSRIMPFAAERERRPRQGPRYSLAIASLVAAAIAASGSATLVITASAAQRQARLVEMARPACDQSGTTNEELHRLARHEYRAGASKQGALRAVVALCLAKSGRA